MTTKSNKSTFFTDYTLISNNDNVRIGSSSIEEVPSNERPLLNLTMNGLLLPSDKIHEVDIKFSTENNPTKDILGHSYGTFAIRKSVLNAAKIVKTKMDRESNILKVVFNLRECPVKKKRVEFSFSVQIRDCGWSCESCSGCVCRASNQGSIDYCYDVL